MNEQSENTQMEQDATQEVAQKRRMGRRGFLKATGALLVGAGLEAACRPEPAATGQAGQITVPTTAPQPPVPATARFPNRVAGQYPAVPDTPSEPPTLGILYFFSLHEAQTVEALTARILPGTPEDPGAREAGVVHYIDFLLSHEHGFAQPIYRSPPFAEPYFGANPPESEGSGGYQVVWVPADQLPRYGYQSSLTPREIYRRGLVTVDQYAQQRFGSTFKELSEDRQDAVVEAMANGEVTQAARSGAQVGAQQRVGPLAGKGAPRQDDTSQERAGPQGAQPSGSDKESGFYPPSLEDFFDVLRSHTIEGIFADPLYGGNRNLVGWKLLGYPGAQRAYTPQELHTEGTTRPPQSIADMPHFHPGKRANGYVLLPVSGANQTRKR